MARYGLASAPVRSDRSTSDPTHCRLGGGGAECEAPFRLLPDGDIAAASAASASAASSASRAAIALPPPEAPRGR